ncbi:hypothetical protein C8R45DRAFT_598120 [Mycena sanguinolenta]|nr:hypothetical protein C8R45DRAFT_598120 [Mycena sanguinolenta]
MSFFLPAQSIRSPRAPSCLVVSHPCLPPRPLVLRPARGVRLVYAIPLALCAVGASRRIASTFLPPHLPPRSTPAVRRCFRIALDPRPAARRHVARACGGGLRRRREGGCARGRCGVESKVGILQQWCQSPRHSYLAVIPLLRRLARDRGSYASSSSSTTRPHCQCGHLFRFWDLENYQSQDLSVRRGGARAREEHKCRRRGGAGGKWQAGGGEGGRGAVYCGFRGAGKPGSGRERGAGGKKKVEHQVARAGACTMRATRDEEKNTSPSARGFLRAIRAGARAWCIPILSATSIRGS